MCSGVLISDTAVLTAAHCFDQDTDSIPINIHVQTQNSTITPCITISSGDNQCGDRLFRVRQHPDWNGNGAANDIAVAHIRSNNLRYRDRAIPSSDIARLYADVWQKSRRQVRTGYGACRNDGFGSGTYREAAVRIQDFFDLHYRDRAQVNNRGCRGDSGGPAYLQAGSERRPIVVGLHSSSVKWGRSECAGVALRQRWVKISPKVAWISSTLGALSGRECRAPFTNVDGVDYRICFD